MNLCPLGWWSGRTGLYHRLAGEAWRYLKDDGLIAMEIGYEQSDRYRKYF